MIIDFVQNKKLTAGLVLDFGSFDSQNEIIAGSKQEYAILNNKKINIPQKMTYDTIFDLASTSKIFTTLAILKLMEENYLDLFDPIVKYVPELKFKVHIKTKVRIDTAKTKEEAEKILFSAYIYPEQELHNSYTDIGAMILRYVVERITALPFSQYITETILKPLNMNDTYLNVPAEKIDRVANENFSMQINCTGDLIERTDNVPGTVNDPKALAIGASYGIAPGHAGFFSTTHDMITLGNALINYTLLKKETVFNMSENVTGHAMANKYSYYYGSLVYCKQPDNLKLGVYHKLSGKAFMSPGYAGTSLYVDPLNQICLFLGSNRLHNRIYDIHKNCISNIHTKLDTGKQIYILPNGAEEIVSLDYTKKKELVIQKALDLALQYKLLKQLYPDVALTRTKN